MDSLNHTRPSRPDAAPAIQRLARLAICFVILTCCGCTALKQPADAGLNTPGSSIDAKRLAAHQANLSVKAAEAAERQGKPDDAIRLYEQARTLDSQWNHVSRRLAVLYDRSGDDARALAAYEQAIALQGNDPDLLNDMGVFHLHRERWAEAEAWFRRVLAAQPRHERAANNLAMSLAMQGRLNESYEAFSQVVGPAAAYSNLGVLLTRQGRTDEAREHFQNALALDNSLHPAEEMLGRLEPSSPHISTSWSNAVVP